jgi:phosphate transport system substrate-binding protein
LSFTEVILLNNWRFVMKKLLWILITFLWVILVSGVSYGGELDKFAGLKGTINIAGGTAHIPVMKDVAKRIMSFNPKIRITITGGGSGVGVQKVGTGLVDIGNTGRPLFENEQKKYGLKSFPFAFDGVAVIVNPKNSVNNLSYKQVRKIYSGEIKNWKEVGGPDWQINLYSRDEASGTRAVFWKKALKKGAISEKAIIVPSNGAMKVAISRDTRGIGYISIGHIDQSVKPVKLNGVMPSQENAINGKYPIVRKLYMNTKGEPKGLVKAFIDYVLSKEGANIIEKHGFIPINKR